MCIKNEVLTYYYCLVINFRIFLKKEGSTLMAQTYGFKYTLSNHYLFYIA